MATLSSPTKACKVYDKFSFSSPWIELWDSEYKNGLLSIHYNSVSKFHSDDNPDSDPMNMSVILHTDQAIVLAISKEDFPLFEKLVEELKTYEDESKEYIDLDLGNLRLTTITEEVIKRPLESSSSIH